MYDEDDEDDTTLGFYFLVALLLLLISGGVFAVYANVVERKVFETSYQRSEGLKTQIATYEAQLEEIRVRVENTEDTKERANLESQAASIRVLLSAAKKRGE